MSTRALMGLVCSLGALSPAADRPAAADPEEKLVIQAEAARADDLVDIRALDPSIQLELRYATTDNISGQALYPVARCVLRREVAERLVRVQASLAERGLGLLVWDCYRPFSVQERLWALVRDGRYVARPVSENGVPKRGSKHNRGAAVDLTLIDDSGRPLAMPSEYDDFSGRARIDHPDASRAARANAALLRRAMKAQGFSAIASEWWHFDGPSWQRYPLLDRPLTEADDRGVSEDQGVSESMNMCGPTCQPRR